MLSHKRSPQTKRAYASDMKDFFGYFETTPSPLAIKDFLSLTKVEAIPSPAVSTIGWG